MQINRPIILASKSPRRNELLGKLNIPFSVQTREVDESYPQGLNPEEIAIYLAEKKSQAFNEKIDTEIVLTADTLVVINNKVLGKAANYEEAFRMLKLLSGNKHIVITAVCLRSKKQIKTFTESTNVYFYNISDKEIADYINNYKPYDKAGAYGIQDTFGLTVICKIEGCYYNVVGLPVSRLYKEMKAFLLAEQ